MPRRTVTKCQRRPTVNLDVLDEWNLAMWSPLIPGKTFPSLDAMRDCWRRHGDRILPHYIKQRPGTRPFALWALGELPLPALKHKPAPHSLRVTMGETTIYSAWHYFGTTTGEDGHYCAGAAWGEFTHLRKLGVIDDAEASLAEEWIDDRYYVPNRPYRDYRPLSND